MSASYHATISQYFDWSLLPPIDPTAKPLFNSAKELYLYSFGLADYQRTFIFGLLLWYALDIVGCSIYQKYVSKDEQSKMQKEQFGGYFISLCHTLIISPAATLVALQYTPLSAFNANTNDFAIILYRHCATLSASYFVLDTIFICCYYKQPLVRTLSFVVHHIGVFAGTAGVFVSAPLIAYISALFMLLEWSTFWLNLRIFSRVWALENMYFVSGLAVMITYPLARLIWVVYVTCIVFNCEYLNYFSAPEASMVIGSAGVFVIMLSAYYYFAVIMRKPKKLFILGPQSKMHKKC